ncbi:efflux RND transporter periplasmic adaptor subunit [Mesoterricola silvestris]|uniref:efflux RND transporter periplasmic adaptor subunit n=1 Tax=Mesoterricola silvestris TaxID=2927979 RepID=UPI00292DBFD0|nr:efflux RND transporter periplasmic adaptor subunit [Mesoterricola silvestris]
MKAKVLGLAAWARSHRWVAGGIPLGILLLLGLMAFTGGSRLTHLTVKVLQGDIRDSVDATGTVSAVITVQVGSQVSGAIARLNADFNSKVRKGDVVALIAPELFQGALLQAQADLANSRANEVAAGADLAKARAALVRTRADFQRISTLAAQKIESTASVDLARANYETAQASVEGAAAAVLQAKAQVSQKEAAVSVARTNLDYTVIRSPIDGTVLARNVDVGQTVAASLQAPTIFTIAQDLTKMQVYAKVDESDVGRIQPGQPVFFTVDAYPREHFTGKVSQIRMNPTRVQNVVTFDAIIDFGNPDLKLFPGMTAYVSIPVAAATNVVKVPNSALRYRPPMSPEEIRTLYARHGIVPGGKDPSGTGRPAQAVVWKRASDGSLWPVEVSLGITDHTFTEVKGGALRAGDEVVTTSADLKNPLPQGGRR